MMTGSATQLQHNW